MCGVALAKTSAVHLSVGLPERGAPRKLASGCGANLLGSGEIGKHD